MNMPAREEACFVLGIAGIGVALVCDDPNLAEALRQWYRDFTAETTDNFILRIHLTSETPAAPAAAPDASFLNGRIEVVEPGYHGSADLKARRAILHIASDQPLYAVEYFLRVMYAALAFEAGGLLFHAAGIARNNRGYCFFGYSGSGKTTVSRLSAGDVVLNDDLVVLLPADDGWMAHATPFWNPTQVRPMGRIAVPLVGLFRLVQDKVVYLEAMSSGQALAEIIASAPVISTHAGWSDQLLARGLQLLQQIPVYELHFLPDASFWDVIAPQV